MSKKEKHTVIVENRNWAECCEDQFVEATFDTPAELDAFLWGYWHAANWNDLYLWDAESLKSEGYATFAEMMKDRG